jgi:hypothetical protein
LPSIRALVDIDLLRRIKQAIETVSSLDEIRQLLPAE